MASKKNNDEDENLQSVRLAKEAMSVAKQYAFEKHGSDTARRAEIRDLIDTIAGEEENK